MTTVTDIENPVRPVVTVQKNYASPKQTRNKLRKIGLGLATLLFGGFLVAAVWSGLGYKLYSRRRLPQAIEPVEEESEDPVAVADTRLRVWIKYATELSVEKLKTKKETYAKECDKWMGIQSDTEEDIRHLKKWKASSIVVLERSLYKPNEKGYVMSEYQRKEYQRGECYNAQIGEIADEYDTQMEKYESTLEDAMWEFDVASEICTAIVKTINSLYALASEIDSVMSGTVLKDYCDTINSEQKRMIKELEDEIRKIHEDSEEEVEEDGGVTEINTGRDTPYSPEVIASIRQAVQNRQKNSPAAAQARKPLLWKRLAANPEAEEKVAKKAAAQARQTARETNQLKGNVPVIKNWDPAMAGLDSGRMTLDDMIKQFKASKATEC